MTDAPTEPGAGRRLPWRASILIPVLLTTALPGLAKAATPRVHAIVGARIVPGPGQVIERGTIVIRDGVFVAVGANVPVPADARIWEADSLTVYPGLIDAFVMPPEQEAPRAAAAAGPGPRRPPAETAARGAAHELATVRPETRMVGALPMAADQVEALRAAGFTVVQLAPRTGIVRGQSAIVSLGGGSANDLVIRADAAQVIALEPARGGYPGSLMGVVAVVRQALADAKWYRDAHAAFARAPRGKERPEENAAWEALRPLVEGRQPAWFVADEMLQVLRAAAIAHEASVRAVVVGAGDEYKRVRDIAAAGVPLVVPVHYPEAPDLADPAEALEVTTEELRHWHAAPQNPATLAKHGVPFALTTHGLKDVKKFRAGVATAIERGLKPADALAAVTTAPARLLGLSDRLGTIAPGKAAHLTVTRGELFSDKGTVVEVWVDGERHAAGKDEQGLKGRWSLAWGRSRHALTVAVDKDTSVKLVVGPDTLRATAVRLEGNRLRFRVQRGTEPAEAFDLLLRNHMLRGTLALAEKPEAGSHAVLGVRLPEEERRKAPGSEDRSASIPSPQVMGNTEAWRAPRPAQPATVLVRNATIWTAGPRGTLRGADLLVRGGRIAALGSNLAVPAGALVIDGTDKHVAPGIIDEHSHSAILGNVNECTNSVTCEVRIQDVVNSESVQIYRQLAGGTTVMHLLHGSCNAIGGQCAVIKNRWGEPPDRLLYDAAPPTVKFALGENPKRSNFQQPGEPSRYPQSRAGVEQVIRDAFVRAQDYRAAMAEWRRGKRPLPPRRDLQLEALQEIIEGKRLVHCHSYRQDEILMMMRLAESFGFRVGTFTHILEGYKVADEMAAHGASAMGFTDWWAYKYEVIDAIPYNGFLLWDRGVNTGFNSDDSELARRLNTEAAKAVKYGGVPPEEAIRFVTLNPARALKIDHRVGSLEVGKDADFSIWTGAPLSPYSVCEQTWVEGRKYFDRDADLAGREALAGERGALIARARAARTDREGDRGGGRRWPPRYLEDSDMSGNDCQGDERPFLSETARRALQEQGARGSREVQR